MLKNVLREIRQQLKMSIKQLALVVGCSKSYLAELESKKFNPSLSFLMNYSEKVGIPLGAIMHAAFDVSYKALDLTEYVWNQIRMSNQAMNLIQE